MPITERPSASTQAAEAWDTIAGSRGGVRGPFALLLHSPEVARLVSEVGAYLRFRSQTDPRLREVAILSTAYTLRCRIEYESHTPIALKVGVPKDALDALAEGRLDDVPEDLRPAARLARDLLTAHRTGDDTFSTLKERLGERGITELVATIGYYSLLACVMNSVETPD